jgi:hypothetical protein
LANKLAWLRNPPSRGSTAEAFNGSTRIHQLSQLQELLNLIHNQQIKIPNLDFALEKKLNGDPFGCRVSTKPCCKCNFKCFPAQCCLSWATACPGPLLVLGHCSSWATARPRILRFWQAASLTSTNWRQYLIFGLALQTIGLCAHQVANLCLKFFHYCIVTRGATFGTSRFASSKLCGSGFRGGFGGSGLGRCGSSRATGLLWIRFGDTGLSQSPATYTCFLLILITMVSYDLDPCDHQLNPGDEAYD